MGVVTSESTSEATEGPQEPLPPPLQPNPPASPGEGTSKKRKKVGRDMYRLRMVPKCVTDLVTKEGGTDIHFIAEKTFKKSDLARQQNRIYLPKDFVQANLVPMLSELERESASLVGDDRNRRRVTEGAKAEKRKTKVSGREHGGLPVVVFTRCKFLCYLKLTRWDGSAGTVIEGHEVKYFLLWSFLKEGDEVEMWAFRRGGDLCFAIADTTKSFIPMAATGTATSPSSSSPIRVQNYPPGLLPRSTTQTQDLCLSHQSFQDPIFHQNPTPSAHNSLLAGSARLGFDHPDPASWAEHKQRMAPWNRAETSDGVGHGGFPFCVPPPQAVPTHSVLCPSQLFSQRGLLQFGNSPSVRSWAEPMAANAEIQMHPALHHSVSSSTSQHGFRA